MDDADDECDSMDVSDDDEQVRIIGDYSVWLVEYYVIVNLFGSFNYVTICSFC